MISSALFSAAFFKQNQSILEVSAVDLSPIGFTFHLSSDDILLMQEATACHVFFRYLRSNASLPLSDFSIEQDEDVFRLITGDPSFPPMAKALMHELSNYQEMKNTLPDGVLSEQMTGYPAKMELDFNTDFQSWRSEWLQSLTADAQWQSAFLSVPSFALSLSSPDIINQFLHLPFQTFWTTYLTQCGIVSHPLSCRLPDAVILGHLFCRELLPSAKELAALLQRCSVNHLTPILALPPIEEDMIAAVTILFDLLAADPCYRSIEIIAGDIGVASLIRDRFPSCFRLTAGPLLIRRRKDPRIQWWLGNPDHLRETSANDHAFAAYLRQLGFQRLCWEACGYPITTTPGSELRFPFYQVNTATRCTLRAACEAGKRGQQKAPGHCSKWCRKQCFLYGKHLPLIGHGNTLWGLDTRSLTDSNYLRHLLQGGVQRITLELL